MARRERRKFSHAKVAKQDQEAETILKRLGPRNMLGHIKRKNRSF
jgi:hypothetical protein